MNIFDSFLVFLCAFLLMIVTYRDFDPRAVLFFVFGLMVAEFFIQLRWRMGVLCPHCGFDPVLYKKSPEKAAERVRRHLERRKNDPRSLLRPPLQLPYRKASSNLGPQSMTPPSGPASMAETR